MTIEFTITHQISNSKGWGRYSAKSSAGPLVQSSTGNEWVSAPHNGELTEGKLFTVTTQTQTVSKSGKKTLDTNNWHLVASAGATAVIGYWTGLEITVQGARRAE